MPSLMFLCHDLFQSDNIRGTYIKLVKCIALMHNSLVALKL